MDKLPVVSVIIPTYGGAKQLERAIFSILNQTYKSLEIIVVDDNNPNSEGRKNTEKILNLFLDKKIIYVKHDRNKNGAAARNSGIDISNGKYICFLDDDDFYLPDRIIESVSALEKYSDYDGVMCGVMDCTDNGLYGVRYHYNGSGNFKNELLVRKRIMGSGSNIFISRKAAIELKGFDTRFQRLQDDEFMVRFYKKFNMLSIDRLLIVKSRNGINNEPSLKNLYKSKNLFFEKFNYDIRQLSKKEQYDFYNYHYTFLLNSAFYEPKSLLKSEILTKVQSIRKLSIKEKFKLVLLNKRFGKYFLFIFRYLNFAGKYNERKKSNQIKNSCTEEEQRIINYYLCYEYDLC